ncbi:MAG: citrate synthase [Verrucomicrobia bacterium]|nr:citrate synthase [Verrucomicrobiota bacterium]MBV9274594.1 citrate synthase [Verrucomicrobiota bacterium]
MAEFAKGLEGVVANETRLGDVRGQEGQLVYCGYEINELAGKVSFEEVIYLLWKDRLPNKAELAELKEQLADERNLPDQVIEFIKTTPNTALPIDVLRTAVSMLGLHDPSVPLDDTLDANRRRAVSIVAKVGIIVAYFHRARNGLDFPKVRRDLGEAAHFLYLLDGVDPSPKKVETLDLAYVLHAEHGMNASTFSARVTISTLTDIYSAVTAAIAALKGPLHGGANEGVIHMLQEIGEPENVDAFLEKTLAEKKRVMGIGHRVYKVLDPRAPHLRRMAIELSHELGEPKWIAMSERIAELMKEKKGLYANVDFYSATVYYSLGIPTDLFTPIFAISRTAGWTAHILEQLSNNRLYRPLSEYVGDPVGRKFAPIDER